MDHFETFEGEEVGPNSVFISTNSMNLGLSGQEGRKGQILVLFLKVGRPVGSYPCEGGGNSLTANLVKTGITPRRLTTEPPKKKVKHKAFFLSHATCFSSDLYFKVKQTRGKLL